MALRWNVQDRPSTIPPTVFDACRGGYKARASGIRPDVQEEKSGLQEGTCQQRAYERSRDQHGGVTRTEKGLHSKQVTCRGRAKTAANMPPKSKRAGRTGDKASESEPIETIDSYLTREVEEHLPTTPEIMQMAATGQANMGALEKRLTDLITKVADGIKAECIKIRTDFGEKFKSIESLQASLEYTQQEVKDLKEDKIRLENKVKELEARQEESQMELLSFKKDTCDALNQLERHSREYNVRLKAVKEEKGENVRQKVVKILEQLGAGRADEINEKIEVAHRIGQWKDNRDRHIIVRLFSRDDRRELLLKTKRRGPGGTNIVVEDLTKIDMELKKKAIPLMNRAYSQGKKVKFVRGRLIVDGKQVPVE